MTTMVVPNGYAEIGIQFARTGLASPLVITFGVKLKATPTAAGIETDIKNAWTFAGSMNGAQPAGTEATYVRYKATYGGLPLAGQQPASWVHGGGGPALASPAVALVVRKATGLAGRKYRGRLMLPWCAESDVDAVGVVAAGTITGYNPALAILKTQLGAAGRAQIDGMYLLHSDATAPTLVTGLTLRSTVGTVRQRQPV